MKLEIHERLALMELFPLESDYAGWKEIRIARENISLTPEEELFIELRTVELPNGGKQLHWNTQKALDAVKDIPLSEYITGLFRKKLSELEKKQKLNEKYFSLFEKFVVSYI
jgi:hypothetical protein